ncbi:hypothetical protein BT67DRAFT_113415 [Trichocladium antarcticum]|uniref:Uncharacterized protein n=1 Tax=Trichocladium antarcticum TaxID=1450529 RepID=A0AAN6ZGH7_9PEZI|nr:hypothetical protein BT67DRAFT_113415 [Trichocladium antarcticum]
MASVAQPLGFCHWQQVHSPQSPIFHMTTMPNLKKYFSWSQKLQVISGLVLSLGGPNPWERTKSSQRWACKARNHPSQASTNDPCASSGAHHKGVSGQQPTAVRIRDTQPHMARGKRSQANHEEPQARTQAPACTACQFVAASKCETCVLPWKTPRRDYPYTKQIFQAASPPVTPDISRPSRPGCCCSPSLLKSKTKTMHGLRSCLGCIHTRRGRCSQKEASTVGSHILAPDAPGLVATHLSRPPTTALLFFAVTPNPAEIPLLFLPGCPRPMVAHHISLPLVRRCLPPTLTACVVPLPP